MESGDGAGTRKLLKSIETRLGSLKKHPDSAIFRVPRNLRQVDPSAYEPMFVSIGPYHYTPALDRHHEYVSIDIDVKERPKLQQGQALKWHFLQDFLGRNKPTLLSSYVKSIHDLEDQARECYVEDVTALDGDEFNQVMLLDACFILEHFLKKAGSENSVYSQHGNNIIITNVSIDLLLLENQLPLVVLEKIYNLFKGQGQHSMFPSSLGELAAKSFDDLTLIQFGKVIRFGSDGDELSSTYHHLLHLLHDQLFRPPHPCHDDPANNVCTPDPDVVRSASTLRDMGVKFVQPKKGSMSLFEINFEDGSLQLPHLQVYDQTGKLFRNLVAFELSSSSVVPYVLPYVLFMDELIDTTRDVDTLEKNRVLTGNIGDNESVASLFNQIGLGCRSITCYRTNYLHETKSRLTKYCKAKRHKWRAKLHHDYFSSPWSILSLVGAIVLLLLTALQTIFTIRSR